jgi:hypothetical protein
VIRGRFGHESVEGRMSRTRGLRGRNGRRDSKRDGLMETKEQSALEWEEQDAEILVVATWRVTA